MARLIIVTNAHYSPVLFIATPEGFRDQCEVFGVEPNIEDAGVTVETWEELKAHIEERKELNDGGYMKPEVRYLVREFCTLTGYTPSTFIPKHVSEDAAIFVRHAKYGDGVAVYAYDEWPEGTQNAGQLRRSYVRGYADALDALRDYPTADVTV